MKGRRAQMRWVLVAVAAVLTMIAAGCHYPIVQHGGGDNEGNDTTAVDSTTMVQARTDTLPDSLRYIVERHYTTGINLEVTADSVRLVFLPLKDRTATLRRGDRVVVAEIQTDTTASVQPDSAVWVKLAHSQEVQGWVLEKDFKADFVPVDSISQAIHTFSSKSVAYTLIILTAFFVAWLVRLYRRQPFKMVLVNDIDSGYPLFLCLMVSTCATLYESMQRFAPDTWEIFYYNPTFSPLQVPLVLGAFIVCFWIIVVAFLASCSEAFDQLSAFSALFYILGLSLACFACYFVFILTVRIYVGYALLAAFAAFFVWRTARSFRRYPYVCGNCGHRLRSKGTCPHCGAENE